jgi:hypothetical protein
MDLSWHLQCEKIIAEGEKKDLLREGHAIMPSPNKLFFNHHTASQDHVLYKFSKQNRVHNLPGYCSLVKKDKICISLLRQV